MTCRKKKKDKRVTILSSSEKMKIKPSEFQYNKIEGIYIYIYI